MVGWWQRVYECLVKKTSTDRLAGMEFLEQDSQQIISSSRAATMSRTFRDCRRGSAAILIVGTAFLGAFLRIAAHEVH